MKTFGLLVLTAAIAVPAGVAGPAPTAADRARAVNDCESVRPSMNRNVAPGTFRRAFGTASAARADAFRNCVRAFALEEMANREAIVAACDAATTTWTEFAECVAAARRAASREDRRDWVNAAETCSDERQSAGGDAFAETYGGGRDAYGRCVSTHAKAQEDEAPAV